MSASKTTTAKGRTAELEFEINAGVEDVWAAITEAEHLMNWFPLTAEVEPGPGGSMLMTWGDAFKGECRIEVWEPNMRLRTTFLDSPNSEGEPMRTYVDYYLEGRGGVTTLRLVHSGFGEGAAWDTLYDAVSRGWAAELRSLRHYIENHFGRRRAVAWVVQPFESSESEVWSKLVSDRCLGLKGLDSLGQDDRYHADGPALGSISGRALLVEKDGAFAGTIDELNDGYFRMEIEHCSGPGPSVWFWVSGYGVPQSEMDGLTERIKRTLGSLIS
ncbi:MAG: SRPBCC domain-containing protein [Phycisphaeraceae bacterium]|nr:SRPBCC domain-containing protein [Phycisphaeraceae bacterium]MCB9847060.1 SRPBCC domain-containing protein [Phycisphaeraceae bacterium]